MLDSIATNHSRAIGLEWTKCLKVISSFITTCNRFFAACLVWIILSSYCYPTAPPLFNIFKILPQMSKLCDKNSISIFVKDIASEVILPVKAWKQAELKNLIKTLN